MRLSRFVRNEHGVAMVEMALVLPIIIMLFLGMVDFGRALFLYNNLANAAREGARYGAARVNPAPTPAEVQAYANTRIREFTCNASAPNAAVATVTTTGSDPKITVAITGYPFNPITPLPMLSNIRLSVSASFRWENAP